MIVGPLLVGLCTVLVTFAGGMLALRVRSRQDALLGFSSGAVIGVALLDLLPEAIKLGTPGHTILTFTAAVACGLLSYLILDSLFSAGADDKPGRNVHLAPASLTAHSAMDGLTIGLAFQVSSEAGLVVAFAVLAHDVVDGANTVTLSLAGGASSALARRWLVADALAPIGGIILARLIPAPASLLALFLGFFAGGFLYIGVSEMLFSGRAGGSSLIKPALVGVGLGFIYIIVRIAAV